MLQQTDLGGQKLEYDKETIEKATDQYRGKYFQVNVSEDGRDMLNRYHEHGKRSLVRYWIAAHMKPYNPLPATEEGKVYQDDLELFCKIL